MTVLAPTRNLDNIVEDLPARGHRSINTDSDVTQNQRTVQNAQRPQLAEEPRPRTSSTLIGLLTISALLLPITIVPFFLVRRRLLRMEMTLDKISQTYENAIRLEVQRLRSAQEAQQILLQNLDKRLFVLSTESKSVHKELVKEQMGIVRRLEENDARFRKSTKDWQNLYTSSDENKTKVQAIEVQFDTLTQANLEYNRVFGRLGRSLADIGAFVQETETRHGIVHDRNSGGGRRVDALRTLGYDLHLLSKESQQHK